MQWGEQDSGIVLDNPMVKKETPDTVGQMELLDYFKQCDENRALLNDIHVVIPVRPADGINCTLHRMVSTWYGEGTAYSDLNDHMGGFIDCTRAHIAYTFVHTPPAKQDGSPCKYLLMIDNDMEPPINLPYLLARHDKPMVGAPAMAVMDSGPSLCFSLQDKKGVYRFPNMRSGQQIPARGLIEVGHVGTGAVMIRRDVLESFTYDVRCGECGYVAPLDESESGVGLSQFLELMNCPTCGTNKHMQESIPFMMPYDARLRGMRTGHLGIGEDIAFCNQLRAKGYKIHVDLEAHCGHRKTVALIWDDERRSDDVLVEDWVLPEFGKIMRSK